MRSLTYIFCNFISRAFSSISFSNLSLYSSIILFTGTSLTITSSISLIILGGDTFRYNGKRLCGR